MSHFVIPNIVLLFADKIIKMQRKSMEKIHHSLKNYEMDENGIIYVKGVPQPFSKEFKYGQRSWDTVRLIGRLFVENPYKCKKLVFKDGNINNITANNLEWSAMNQDYYNFSVENPNMSSGKYCRKCKDFKSYDNYDCSPNGNKLNFCKQCLSEKRKLKEEEYNNRRNERRKNSPLNSLYNKLKYEKLKDNTEEYQKYLAKVKKYSEDNWWIDVLSRLKRSAKDNNLPFNLTKEDLFIPEKCPLLDIPMSLFNPDKMKCVSWDKIIPSLGYVKGNVRAISFKANLMKNNCNFKELETFSKNIIKYMEDYKQSTLNQEVITESMIKEILKT